jgi:hypothetical protein
MVPALRRLCFGETEVPPTQSIEDLFQQAAEAGDLQPMKQLVRELQKADYYLAHPLSHTTDSLNNRYAQFFEDFCGASYLTFNYDSLVEIFLMKLGRWDPRCGYGVRVRLAVLPNASPRPIPALPSLVLHLHGTFCVETVRCSHPQMRPNSIAWIEPLDEPEYYFQPGPTGPCFTPFEREKVGGSLYATEWVIAPIPTKATRLSEPFIKTMYRQAVTFAREQSPLVVIGYSFNAHDKASFDPILRAVGEGGAQAVVVSPDAASTVVNLREMYPAIEFRPIPSGFADWVNRDYPGLDGRPA